MTKLSIFLMTFLLSLNVWSFRESGGGSLIEEQIKARFLDFDEYLTKSTDMSIDHVLSERRLKSGWSNTRMGASILSNELVARNGLTIKTVFEYLSGMYSHQSFIDKTFYYSSVGRSRILYVEIRRFLAESSSQGFDLILFHEYLRIVAVDDNDYAVSRILYPRYQAYLKYKDSIFNVDSMVNRLTNPLSDPTSEINQ